MLFGPTGSGSGSGVSVFTTTQRDAIASPSNGQVIFNSTTNRVQQYDTVNNIWRDVGDPLAINYITNWNGESGSSSGWATYNNGAVTVPTTGTGGTPTVTIATQNDTALYGNRNFALTKNSGASVQGQGWSYNFSIDRANQGKVLNISFGYLVEGGSFVAGTSNINISDITVWIYDVGNSVLIQPSNISLFSNSTFTGDIYRGTFQTNYNSTTYRLILHYTNTTTTALNMAIDNVTVAPSNYIYGSPITDWVSYTPTFTGFGTVVTQNFVSRRVGSNLEVKGTYTVATSTAVLGQISIGYNGANSNVVIDTTKTPPSSICGIMSYSAASTVSFNANVIVPSANQSFVNFAVRTSTANEQSAQQGTAFAAGALLQVQFSVPIVGWASSVQMSSEADTRVVGSSVNSATTSISTADTTVLFPTISFDTHNGYSTSTGTYTCQASGYYNISAGLEITSATAINDSLLLKIKKNGTAISQSFVQAYASATRLTPNTSILVSLVSGDTIIVTGIKNQNAQALSGTVGTYLNISKASGPQAIASTESVNCRYFASSTTISGTLATIVWTTKDYDSHGAMTAGVFTCPTSGKYQLNSNLQVNATITLNNVLDFVIQKNGVTISEFQTYAGGAMTAQNGQLSDTVNCLAGDTLRFQVSHTGTTPSINASNVKNFVSIIRVGN